MEGESEDESMHEGGEDVCGNAAVEGDEEEGALGCVEDDCELRAAAREASAVSHGAPSSPQPRRISPSPDVANGTQPKWLGHTAFEPLLRTARESGDGLKELSAKVRQDVTRVGDAVGENVGKMGDSLGNRLLRVLACTPRDSGRPPLDGELPVERQYLFHNGQARDGKRVGPPRRSLGTCSESDEGAAEGGGRGGRRLSELGDKLGQESAKLLHGMSQGAGELGGKLGEERAKLGGLLKGVGQNVRTLAENVKSDVETRGWLPRSQPTA